MKKILLIAILFPFIVIQANSQELNCRVQVNSSQVQGVSKKVFQDMQKDIFEFMNNTKWTKYKFNTEERIECTIFITINQAVSIDEFKASIQVQSVRPVYNSNYKTMLFNFKDNDFQFQYSQFQPLQFNENTANPNLVAVLAYYAYIILGYDFDSFSPLGGTEFFKKAEKIVNNMQGAREKGWKAFESTKNRYWLVHNLLDKKFTPLREFMYKYHRLGIDLMADKPEEGRRVIAENLTMVRKVYRVQPGNMLVKLFYDAKSQELISIFKEAMPDEKSRVINILKETDPSNASNYEKIRKSGN
jgi:hypothetical protein